MTALSATNRNVIGEALTDVSSDGLYPTYQKRQIYLLDGLHYICFFFIYCCTTIKVSIVLFIVCKILPKYILHSSNLYDLGNSPVA